MLLLAALARLEPPPAALGEEWIEEDPDMVDEPEDIRG